MAGTWYHLWEFQVGHCCSLTMSPERLQRRLPRTPTHQSRRLRLALPLKQIEALSFARIVKLQRVTVARRSDVVLPVLPSSHWAPTECLIERKYISSECSHLSLCKTMIHFFKSSVGVWCVEFNFVFSSVLSISFLLPVPLNLIM